MPFHMICSALAAAEFTARNAEKATGSKTRTGVWIRAEESTPWVWNIHTYQAIQSGPNHPPGDLHK